MIASPALCEAWLISLQSLGQCYDCHQWWCLQFEWSGQSASPHRHLNTWAPSEFDCVLPCHHTLCCSKTVDTLPPSSRWRWWALSKTAGSQRRDCHAELTFYFGIDDLGTPTTCQSYCDPGGCSSVCCMLCMCWHWPEASALLGTWWCPLWWWWPSHPSKSTGGWDPEVAQEWWQGPADET